MLTKSDFLLYLDAPMHLWAEKHGKLQITQPSPYEQHLMKQGYEVEKLAHEYLRTFVLPTYSHAELLWQQTYTTEEFQIRTDGIIHDLVTDKYHLYEIKSSTVEKNNHIPDATFQYIVMGKSISVESINILLLNESYVREETLNIEQLFQNIDVTQDVLDLIQTVTEQMQASLKIVQSENPEGIVRCINPKTCPCIDLCHPNLPPYSIYNIPNLSIQKRREFSDTNTISINEIDATDDFTPKQQKVIDVLQTQTPYIDKPTISSLLHSLTYPLYFLDYETYDEAIPLYKGQKPYQKMVFQYSLHIIQKDSDAFIHKEYVAAEQGDPIPGLLKHMREDIGDEGSVIVWNKTFEGGRNKEMAEQFPEYKDFLLSINNRMFDLMEIVSKGHYLHPEFKGRWSIKQVLPVMVPELSYESLSINKGDLAMVAWWEMVQSTNQEEKQKTTDALLEYCKLDTLAMLKIWEKLLNIIKT